MAINVVTATVAAENAFAAAKNLADLGNAIQSKPAGRDLHPDTKADIAGDFPAFKTAWETARDALDTELSA